MSTLKIATISCRNFLDSLRRYSRVYAGTEDDCRRFVEAVHRQSISAKGDFTTPSGSLTGCTPRAGAAAGAGVYVLPAALGVRQSGQRWRQWNCDAGQDDRRDSLPPRQLFRCNLRGPLAGCMACSWREGPFHRTRGVDNHPVLICERATMANIVVAWSSVLGKRRKIGGGPP